VDLSADGNQPMHSACGRYVIVFNGEIYNYVELRRELEAQGVVFRTSSDTEVLLQGLIREGPSFQLRCNGMWAFGMWDRRDGTGLLGRDRFGKKPLFYSQLAKGVIAFASEMKGLYPFMKSVEPSRDIDRHFRDLFRYEHTEECVIQGIHRLRAGHWAIWRDGNLSARRWWNTLDHIGVAPKRYEEQVEQWRELFLDAVRIRLRADVPVGTTLSGGLDSSSSFCSVAHLASRNQVQTPGLGRWRRPFCATFEVEEMDESLFARVVAQHVGVDLNEVPINPLQSGWSLLESLFQVEDPYSTLPFPMLATYRAIRDEGTRVTIDGHGADELFSGYGHLRFAEWEASSPEKLAEVRAIIRSTTTGEPTPETPMSPIFWWRHRMACQIRKGLTPVARLGQSLACCPQPPLAQVTFHEDQHHEQFLRMDLLSRGLYEALHTTFLPTLLRNYDRYSMACGIETRMPFLDWRLVCFTFALPWTSKIGGGFTKRILRDAMEGILPEPIRQRRTKRGWESPMHSWLRGPMREEIEEIVETSSGLPEQEAARQAWRRFLQTPKVSRDDGERVWTAIQPVVWRTSLTRGTRGIVGQSLAD
jgi:asparagine synthase (glutamine-hydrolysing)